MTSKPSIVSHGLRWLRFIAVSLVFIAGAGLLMVWLAGGFATKVPTDSTAASERSAKADRVETVEVKKRKVSRIESAAGTVRAVHETSIGSKLLARVVEMNLKAGQRVRAGDVLVRLDDTDLQAKLKQARAAVAAAEANRNQAATDEKRYAALVQTRTISRQEYDRAVTALQTAEAESNRARAAVGEVEATLAWTVIRAPMDGAIIDKKADVGDMVAPGQILCVLFDPKRMQLVANVRESLAQRLQSQIGGPIGVELEGHEGACSGTISEIVPESQSASRTFQVKVTGPCPAGVYSGMFGRILIPLDEEDVLVVPRRAVRNVGQLSLVEAVENGHLVRRSIRTGRTFGDDIEVLSGLREGERVVVQ